LLAGLAGKIEAEDAPFNIDMMWMWTSTIVVLLGAQLDSAIDQQTDALSH
jgi:uncharacterized BrkB/YihY/UPF0761 family membrane protein